MTTRTETITRDGYDHYITLERHGYRVRMWDDGFGYLGSYHPQTKRVGYGSSDGKHQYQSTARGPLDAIRQLLDYHLSD